LPISREKGAPSDQFINDIFNAVAQLNSSVLAIQGPPGSGKTTTANAVISMLIQDGKRVGIMSNSHSAIFNLQQKVVMCNPNLGHAKVGGLGSTITEFDNRYPALSDVENFVYRTSSSFTKKQPYSSFATVGATVYAFVKDDAVNAPLDYLFVDEASQVALANLIAVTPSTTNIVLMGDQMQLEQPVQGAHPGIAKKSALEHLLQGHKVIPDDKGVFLDKTYRMHPDVCQPISDLVYESKLNSAEQTTLQAVKYSKNALNLHENGIQFIPVEHQYNTQASAEEVNKIKEILAQLESSQLIDNKGVTKPFTKDDVLIVAPYNMQVELLKNSLSAEYQIGTIDKFQGKEAQVVIISMASSLAEESARGIDFLFDVNRLNVAVSRAKALAIIVASPELTSTRASNPEQVKKVAAFFKLIGGNHVACEPIDSELKIKKEVISWRNYLPTKELSAIDEVLSNNCHSKNNVNAFLNAVIEQAPTLDIWATNTKSGDIRIGVKPSGKARATICYITIHFSSEDCFVNLAHSYFIAVLGGSYKEHEVNNLAKSLSLDNYLIGNGSKPSTLNIRVKINNIDDTAIAVLGKNVSPRCN
jgi:uncharacterized protein